MILTKELKGKVNINSSQQYLSFFFYYKGLENCVAIFDVPPTEAQALKIPIS